MWARRGPGHRWAAAGAMRSTSAELAAAGDEVVVLCADEDARRGAAYSATRPSATSSRWRSTPDPAEAALCGRAGRRIPGQQRRPWVAARLIHRAHGPLRQDHLLLPRLNKRRSAGGRSAAPAPVACAPRVLDGGCRISRPAGSDYAGCRPRARRRRGGARLVASLGHAGRGRGGGSPPTRDDPTPRAGDEAPLRAGRGFLEHPATPPRPLRGTPGAEKGLDFLLEGRAGPGVRGGDRGRPGARASVASRSWPHRPGPRPAGSTWNPQGLLRHCRVSVCRPVGGALRHRGPGGHGGWAGHRHGRRARWSGPPGGTGLLVPRAAAPSAAAWPHVRGPRLAARLGAAGRRWNGGAGRPAEGLRRLLAGTAAPPEASG